jgi:hypothetical protein
MHLAANLTIVPVFGSFLWGGWFIPIIVTAVSMGIGQGIEAGKAALPTHNPDTTVVRIWAGMTDNLNDTELANLGGAAPEVALYDELGELLAAGEALDHRKPVPEGSFREYHLKHLEKTNTRQASYIKVTACKFRIHEPTVTQYNPQDLVTTGIHQELVTASIH